MTKTIIISHHKYLFLLHFLFLLLIPRDDDDHQGLLLLGCRAFSVVGNIGGISIPTTITTTRRRQQQQPQQGGGGFRLMKKNDRTSLLYSSTSSTSAAAAAAAAPAAGKTMNLLGGVRDLVDDYDVFLLDMWGVMHDGSSPYDGVLDVVQELKSRNKEMIILSNSSKRQDNSVKMLKKLGFNPDDFKAIITSGEVAYNMLSGQDKVLGCEPWKVISNLRQSSPSTATTNNKVFVYGSGDGDEEYCTSCGWSLAPLNEASLIVARGTFTINDGKDAATDKRNDPEKYDRMLSETIEEASKRRIPMIVCNPDKVRPDVGRPPMPGMIGDLYEKALDATSSTSSDSRESLVKRIGKPFSDVYDIAMSRASSTDLSRVCMVGDALETDVTGGSAMGISTVWVLEDGIHGPDLGVDLVEGAQSVLESFNQLEGTYAKGKQLSPTFLMPSFRW